MSAHPGPRGARALLRAIARVLVRLFYHRIEVVGLERVLAFHLNDARTPLGSGLDRHEHIGCGSLGLTPFRLLLNDRRFRRIPKVLETPKDPEPAADLRNLAVLRRLRGVSGPRSRPPGGRAR